MPVYRKPQSILFTPSNPVEKHFHDHDETWIVTSGSCRAFMVGRDGTKDEFELSAGDVWMVEAGVEHGCDPHEGGVGIFPFPGTLPVGSHSPGHYYMEREGYMPTLCVDKEPLARYGKADGDA